MQKISSEQYLRNHVRGEGYNLYLLHFFTPRAHRLAVLSLMALHCELRSIPKKVQDPTMMLIRLQWWRDEIAKDNPADSPILNTLPKLYYNDYFNRFEQSLRGEPVDIDEIFYTLISSVILDKQAKEKFSRKLMHHDALTEKNSKLHALRLWLGV